MSLLPRLHSAGVKKQTWDEAFVSMQRINSYYSSSQSTETKPVCRHGNSSAGTSTVQRSRAPRALSGSFSQRGLDRWVRCFSCRPIRTAERSRCCSSSPCREAGHCQVPPTSTNPESHLNRWCLQVRPLNCGEHQGTLNHFPPATTPRPNLSPDSWRARIWARFIPRGPLSSALHSSPSQSRRAMWTARVWFSSGASRGLQRLSTVFTPSRTRPAYGCRNDRHHTCTDMSAEQAPELNERVRGVSVWDGSFH